MADYQDVKVAEIDFINEPDRYKLDNFEVYKHSRVFRKKYTILLTNYLKEKNII
ncbi:MAG: hypothetical protein IIA61_04320 [Candidatus Marinimicrobia bacterium]|nr:hypothetical protein [Candidatus Neomarinimicrobiota bacterium]